MEGGPTNPLLGFSAAFKNLYGDHNANYQQNEICIEMQRLEGCIRQNNEAKTYNLCFAEYLRDASKSISFEYYTLLLQFMLKYADCLKSMDPNNLDCDQIPQNANKFLGEYFQKNNDNEFEKYEALAIVYDLNKWLFDRNFTNSRLKIIGESS